MKFILRTFIALAICLFSFQVSATHLMGGNITYECVSGNTYLVKVDLYRDCNGITLGNSVGLNIASASCANTSLIVYLVNNLPTIVTPICSSAPDVCNDPAGFYGVEKYSYEGTITLGANCGDFTISYSSCCRNAAITTLSGASNASFYLHTTVNIGLTPCNNSPTFDFDPLFYACLGDTAVYTHGVYDQDGDNLVFSLVSCGETATTSVQYNFGFSGTNPLTTSYLQVNPTTGTVKFVPTIAEVGVICMLVEEYRNGTKISEVIRDIQIDIKNCLGNQLPVLSGINGTANLSGTTGGTSIELTAGASSCFTIDGFDANTTQNLAIDYINSLPGATYNINSTGNTTQATICWTPTLSDIGTHHFAMSIADNACPIIAKSNYAYVINVTAGPSTVQGTITRSDGLPLSNSKVYGYLDLFTIVDSTTTDSLGFYSLTASVSTIKVQAVPNAAHINQQSTFYQNAVFYVNGVTIPLDPATPAIADFSTLPGGVVLSGLVTRQDGQALDNSWMHLIDSSMTTIASIQTNSQGQYAFTIPDITVDYYVRAVPGSNHGDQVTTYYNGSLTLQSANAIDIVSSTNFANFSTIDTSNLIGEKFIGGTVYEGTDFTPTPLVGIRLILNDANGNFINDVLTNNDGQFRFNGLSNGTYQVFVDKAGVNNNLAPTIVIDANESSPEDLEFLLHSSYLEMFYATSTVEIYNNQSISIYPNPIQTTFTIEYDLTTATNVKIDLMDVQGKVVNTIINEQQMAGEHQHLGDFSKNLNLNGIYFLRFQFDNQTITKKILIQTK